MNQRHRMARKRWSVAKMREERLYGIANLDRIGRVWGRWSRSWSKRVHAAANLRLLTGEVRP